jgi:hypothetical protein
MNLTDVERLVRRIGELLDGRVPEDQARPMAQAYATLSERAAHRLRQCATMLDQGDEAQALQLADSPPPLLDLVTRLGFRRLSEWRDYCQKQELPCAENLDAKFIRQLNDAYGKGIAPEHQLYRRLREAVQSRDDLGMIDALRAIRRRNPADTGVHQQLERLERRILVADLDRIKTAITNSDDARVVSLVEEIDARDFDARPEGETWKSALLVRCRVLLQQAARLQSRQDWASAASIVANVHNQIADEGLSLGSNDAKTLAELDAWLVECRRKDAEDRDFARTQTELRTVVGTCEQHNEAAVRSSRATLRERLQTLESGWRKLEGFRRPVDEDLARRRKKAVDILQDQLDARNRFVRRWVLVGLTLLVALATVLGRTFWNQRRAAEWALELQSLRETRRVGVAELALVEATQHLGRLAGSSPELRSQVNATEQFIAAEHARRRECETLVEPLVAAANAGFVLPNPPEETQARFDAAEKLLSEVAEDLQPPLLSRLTETRQRWDAWLLSQRRQREDAFDLLVAETEKVAGTLTYDRGPIKVAEILSGLTPGLQKLKALAMPPVAGLRLSSAAITRLSALTQHVEAFAVQADRWQVITNAWRHPRTLETYLAALQELQRSEFASSTDRTRARVVLSMNLTASSLPSGLLLPGDSEGWRRFEIRPALERMPAQVLPGERTRFNALRDDQNLFGIIVHQLTRPSTSPGEPRESWTAYSRGPLTRNKFGRKIGQVYDPVFSPGLVEFHAREFNSAEYLIEESGPAPETALADRVGLKTWIESGTSTNFSAPLLSILDAINRTDLGSPLCRAFLALKLHELMDLRPHDWDAHWAPQAAQDRQRLRELGAASIASGDWMDSRRTTALAQQLEGHFATARRVSYPQQAAFLLGLAREAAHAGFLLIGNADAAGTPHLPWPLPDRTEIWGWTEDTRVPALLCRIQANANDTTWITLRRSMPFSPLFTFRGDRKKLLEDARRNASTQAETLGPYLPPLFATDHE